LAFECNRRESSLLSLREGSIDGHAQRESDGREREIGRQQLVAAFAERIIKLCTRRCKGGAAEKSPPFSNESSCLSEHGNSSLDICLKLACILRVDFICISLNIGILEYAIDGEVVNLVAEACIKTLNTFDEDADNLV
jgi:hypothetical protein